MKPPAIMYLSVIMASGVIGFYFPCHAQNAV